MQTVTPILRIFDGWDGDHRIEAPLFRTPDAAAG
jgi:hypothetical protein